MAVIQPLHFVKDSPSPFIKGRPQRSGGGRKKKKPEPQIPTGVEALGFECCRDNCNHTATRQKRIFLCLVCLDMGDWEMGDRDAGLCHCGEKVQVVLTLFYCGQHR